LLAFWGDKLSIMQLKKDIYKLGCADVINTKYRVN